MTDRRKLAGPIDEERLNLALKTAVQRALWEHKQLGIAISVVQDGKLVTIPPEEIVVEKPAEKV